MLFVISRRVAISQGLGAHWWREMDSNLWFLVERPSNRSWETGLLARKRERICWGTGSSNPSPSTGESIANLTFRAHPIDNRRGFHRRQRFALQQSARFICAPSRYGGRPDL